MKASADLVSRLVSRELLLLALKELSKNRGEKYKIYRALEVRIWCPKIIVFGQGYYSRKMKSALFVARRTASIVSTRIIHELATIKEVLISAM